MKTLTVVGSLGIVLGAAYLLYTMQRVYLGKAKAEYGGFPDLTRVEYAALVPLAVLSVVFGVFPNLVLGIFNAPMKSLLTMWPVPVQGLSSLSHMLPHLVVAGL